MAISLILAVRLMSGLRSLIVAYKSKSGLNAFVKQFHSCGKLAINLSGAGCILLTVGIVITEISNHSV